MKKRAYIILAVILFAASCLQAEGEFLIFHNYFYGFKAPANFEATEKTMAGCNFQLQKEKNNPKYPLILIVKAAKSPTNDLELYASKIIPANKKSFLENFVEIKDVKENLGLLGASVAKEVEYIGEGLSDIKTNTVTSDDAVTLNIGSVNVPVIYKNVFTIQNGIVYILTYGGQEKLYKEYEKDFNSVVKSFVINRNLKTAMENKYKDLQKRINKYPPLKIKKETNR